MRNNKRAAFSVNGDDGYPYTIPINFYYDEEENKIYFHGAKKGHKIDSIKKNDKVCLTTWNDGYVDDGDWAYHVSSCVIFGRARLVDDIMNAVSIFDEYGHHENKYERINRIVSGIL